MKRRSSFIDTYPIQPLPMPRTTNFQASKAYRATAKPYDAIADVFKSGDGRRLKAEFDVGRSMWRDVSRLSSLSMSVAA